MQGGQIVMCQRLELIARPLIFRVDSYLDTPNKRSRKGMRARHVKGAKNAKNEQSSERMNIDFDSF